MSIRFVNLGSSISVEVRPFGPWDFEIDVPWAQVQGYRVTRAVFIHHWLVE